MRSCKENIRTIENGEKNLFLRRTFNALFAGAGKKRKRETSTSVSNVQIAKNILKTHNNNVQHAFNEWRKRDDGPSIQEKFRLLAQEAAKIANEEKPKRQKKEKETCPVCFVEIDTLPSEEYTMCPTCKRPICNACLCKRYKTTGYNAEGMYDHETNRSKCPLCNGQIPRLDILCLPR